MPRQMTYGQSFDWQMQHHPELRARYCQRCQVRYHPYIPRQPGTDHCTWCEEELQRDGRMVIGAGLEEAAGWIQIPENVMDESTDKEEHNRRYREKRRTGRCLNCGKPVDARSPRCASCATKKRHPRRARQKAAEMELVTTGRSTIHASDHLFE